MTFSSKSSEIPGHEKPLIAQMGETAVVVEVDGDVSLAAQQMVWALAKALEERDGIVETGLGMNNLLIIYDTQEYDFRQMCEMIARLWDGLQPPPLEGRTWEFPVVYGGERGADLATVAAHAGVSPAEAASMHSECEFIIFAPSVTPGYGYLFGLRDELILPRKARPIMLKEAGTISIGGIQCTIGMTPGPSGWYALGYTPSFRNPFDPDSDPPLEVQVGDRIRFTVEDVLS